MNNITLVSTRHDKLGKCNSQELYSIFERVNPEVIFEEIPPSYFDKYYKSRTCINLETDTINWYLEAHNINHIPVDSDDVPSESFFSEYEAMLKSIEGITGVEGFHYRNIIDTYRSNSEMYGFKYLNSIYCIILNDDIFSSIKKGLQKINKDKFFQTNELWKNVQEKRENEMLKNIYNYNKEHSYDKAIFTLGAAHRKSIMKKIREFEKKEQLKLNWTFYNEPFAERAPTGASCSARSLDAI